MLPLLVVIGIALAQDPTRREITTAPDIAGSLDRLANYQQPILEGIRDQDGLVRWLAMLADLFPTQEEREVYFDQARSLEEMAETWMGAAGSREFRRLRHGGERITPAALLDWLHASTLEESGDPIQFPRAQRLADEFGDPQGEPGSSVLTGPANLGFLLHGALADLDWWIELASVTESTEVKMEGPTPTALRAQFITDILHVARAEDQRSVYRASRQALRPLLATELTLEEGADRVAVVGSAPENYGGALHSIGFTPDHLTAVDTWLAEIERSRMQEEPNWSDCDGADPRLSFLLSVRRWIRDELEPERRGEALCLDDLTGPMPVAEQAWARLLEMVGPRAFREKAWPAIGDMFAGRWPLPGLDERIAELEHEIASFPSELTSSIRRELQDLNSRKQNELDRLAGNLAQMYTAAVPSATEGWEGMLELTQEGISDRPELGECGVLAPAYLVLTRKDTGLAMEMLDRYSRGEGPPLPLRAVEATLLRMTMSGGPGPNGIEIIERLACSGTPWERLAALGRVKHLPAANARRTFEAARDDLRQIEGRNDYAVLFNGACDALLHPDGWPGRSAALRQLIEAAAPRLEGAPVFDAERCARLTDLLDPEDRAALAAQGLLPTTYRR